MPKAICLICGRIYYGWALLQKKYRTCECGCKLVFELVEE